MSDRHATTPPDLITFAVAAILLLTGLAYIWTNPKYYPQPVQATNNNDRELHDHP